MPKPIKETLYPHRRYLLANLLLGRSPKTIVEDCVLHNFDIPDNITLNQYKKFITDEFPHLLNLKIDFDKLLQYGLYHLVAYELQEDETYFDVRWPMSPLGMEGAFKIVEDPHMRRLITVMSLCDIKDEDIELIVNARYNYNYASEDVRMFVQYFADFSEFKFSERQAYINNIQDKVQRKIYSYALDGDKNMLLWKLGLAPDKSFDAMLRDVAVDCYYNYKEQLNINESNEAQKWAGLLLKVQERLDKMDVDDTSKTDLFGSVVFQVQALKTNTTEIQTPEQVQLDMPSYVLNNETRHDIVSIEDLEALSNRTPISEKDQKENDDNE